MGLFSINSKGGGSRVRHSDVRQVGDDGGVGEGDGVRKGYKRYRYGMTWIREK